MIAVALIGGVIAGLLILYLITPQYRPFVVSFARFFQAQPTGEAVSRVFSLRNLILSRLFWLQLLTLIILLLAPLLSEAQLNANRPQQRIGVWVLLDTSASMSTMQDGQSRMALALNQLEEMASRLTSLQAEMDVCVQLSGFDLEVWGLTTATPQQLTTLAQQFDVRPLGTNLSLVRRMIGRLSEQANETCSITHLVIITDQPAPEWLGEAADQKLQTLWFDIGKPVDNIAILDARRTQTVLGQTQELVVEFAAYGTIPQQTLLTVFDTNGAIDRQLINWDRRSFARLEITLPGAGQYVLSLPEGDAYSFDDRLTISVDDTQTVRVDWQLADKTILSVLKWQEDSVSPNLRVLPYPDALSGTPVPTLLVGNGYDLNGSPGKIQFFTEDPLIDRINFDVAEALPISGVSLSTLNPLQPVLYDERGLAWIAINEAYPAVLIPGLPQIEAEENLRAFSTTVFFNALRWLLTRYTPPPLYTLTTTTHPTIEGNRNALHPNEGFTLPPQSAGDMTHLQPLNTSESQFPVWLMLLTCAALSLLIERYLSMFGSSRWQ